jgi:hypothetical protein
MGASARRLPRGVMLAPKADWGNSSTDEEDASYQWIGKIAGKTAYRASLDYMKMVLTIWTQEGQDYVTKFLVQKATNIANEDATPPAHFCRTIVRHSKCCWHSLRIDTRDPRSYRKGKKAADIRAEQDAAQHLKNVKAAREFKNGD